MSKTYMKKEKGDGKIVCVALADWQRYRIDGYVFVETDKDGNTPAAQFAKQAAAPAPVAESEDDGTPTEDNTKAEIVAYLVANDIEHDAGEKKADLLALIG